MFDKLKILAKIINNFKYFYIFARYENFSDINPLMHYNQVENNSQVFK